MEPEKASLRGRFKEWFVGHALWELFTASVAALVVSLGIARETSAVLAHAVNWFLIIAGTLGILWSVGVLPRKPKASEASHRAGLVSKYQDLVFAWTQLDNLYQNSQKNEHVPKPLPNSMESRQIGDLDFRYRIGFLQAKTHALLDDLSKAGIEIGYEREDIRSVPELLRVLERSKL